MKLSIILSSGCVVIDNVPANGIDLSFFDPTYHAIQWYGTYGEIEIKDIETGKILENMPITEIDEIYNQIFPLYDVKVKEREAEEAKFIAELKEREENDKAALEEYKLMMASKQ